MIEDRPAITGPSLKELLNRGADVGEMFFIDITTSRVFFVANYNPETDELVYLDVHEKKCSSSADWDERTNRFISGKGRNHYMFKNLRSISEDNLPENIAPAAEQTRANVATYNRSCPRYTLTDKAV